MVAVPKARYLTVLIPELPQIPRSVAPTLSMPQVRPYGPELKQLLKAIRPVLSKIFGSRQTICLIPETSDFVWTGIFAGLGARRVMHFVTGPDSQRRLALSRKLGNRAGSVKIPFGAVVAAQGAEAVVNQTPDLAAICLGHTDLCSGILNPISEISRSAKAAGRPLILVDGSFAAASTELHFDRDQLDAYVVDAGSLGLPHGLTIAALSHRFFELCEEQDAPWQLLNFEAWGDLLNHPEQLARMPQSQFFALAATLQSIEQETLPARISRHWRLAARVRAFAQECFEQAAALGYAAYTFTAVKTPESFPLEQFHKALEAKGLCVGRSLDRRHPVFRIAHTGATSLELLEAQLDLIAVTAHELIQQFNAKTESGSTKSTEVSWHSELNPERGSHFGD